VNAFFNWYPELNTDVTENQVTDFINYLNNPCTDNLTLAEFNDKLAELFPELYDQGVAEEDNQMSVDNVGLSGEDTFGAEAGFDPNEQVDPSFMGGDFGGGGDFMDDGSFGAMIDQVSGDEVPLPEEGVEDTEIGADNGSSQQAVDKQDEVIGAMTNI